MWSPILAEDIPIFHSPLLFSTFSEPNKLPNRLKFKNYFHSGVIFIGLQELHAIEIPLAIVLIERISNPI